MARTLLKTNHIIDNSQIDWTKEPEEEDEWTCKQCKTSCSEYGEKPKDGFCRFPTYSSETPKWEKVKK